MNSYSLVEGYGEAIYEIGVADKGELVGLPPADLKASFETLRRMGVALNADVSIIRERVVSPEGMSPRLVAEVLIRKGMRDEQYFLEIGIAVVGGGDGGSKFISYYLMIKTKFILHRFSNSAPYHY